MLVAQVGLAGSHLYYYDSGQLGVWGAWKSHLVTLIRDFLTWDPEAGGAGVPMGQSGVAWWQGKILLCPIP